MADEALDIAATIVRGVGRTGALWAERVGLSRLAWLALGAVGCRFFGCSAVGARWGVGGLLVGEDDGGSDGLCNVGVVGLRATLSSGSRQQAHIVPTIRGRDHHSLADRDQPSCRGKQDLLQDVLTMA
jgi:hypothetical protein